MSSVASIGFPVSASPPAEVKKQVAAEQTDVSAKTEPKTKPQLIRSTEDLQKISHAFNKKLQFVVDQTSNQVIVKVIDKDTDKVIRELPPEELQRLHKNLREAIGLLFDEMV